jgi:hypothetical protein
MCVILFSRVRPRLDLYSSTRRSRARRRGGCTWRAIRNCAQDFWAQRRRRRQTRSATTRGQPAGHKRRGFRLRLN